MIKVGDFVWTPVERPGRGGRGGKVIAIEGDFARVRRFITRHGVRIAWYRLADLQKMT